jgi:hypothetical protein
MLDKRDKLFGYFNQVRGSDSHIRKKEYECFRDDAKLDYLRNGSKRKDRITNSVI